LPNINVGKKNWSRIRANGDGTLRRPATKINLYMAIVCPNENRWNSSVLEKNPLLDLTDFVTSIDGK
jgi:hypothetical protein